MLKRFWDLLIICEFLKRKYSEAFNVGKLKGVSTKFVSIKTAFRQADAAFRLTALKRLYCF